MSPEIVQLSEWKDTLSGSVPKELCSVSLMALTASAPNDVQVEITDSVLSSHLCNLDRPNIHLFTSQVKAMSITW